MMVELEDKRLNYLDNDSEGPTNQSMLLPEPARNKGYY
jgi:hypothetical protein